MADLIYVPVPQAQLVSREDDLPAVWKRQAWM